jgi:hypothetical protein
MDHEDNVIRNPNEILWGWSLEQVMTAMDIKDVRAEHRAKQYKARQEKQKTTTPRARIRPRHR